MPNFSCEIERTWYENAPKFSAVVVSRSGLNRCSIRIVLKVNKTKCYVSWNSLIINMRGRIAEEIFSRKKRFECCFLAASDMLPSEHSRFVFDFSWVTLRPPPSPPAPQGMTRHLPFSRVSESEFRCDVSDGWRTLWHVPAAVVRPAVYVAMLAMFHSSPAVI